MLSEPIDTGLADEIDAFFENGNGLYWLGSTWGALTTLNYASARVPVTEVATSGRYLAATPAGALNHEIRLRAGTLADSKIIAYGPLAVSTLPNSTEAATLAAVEALPSAGDIADEVVARTHGSGTNDVAITVKNPDGDLIAGALVVARLNGLWQGEAATHYEDPEEEDSAVLPAVLNLDDSPSYRISIEPPAGYQPFEVQTLVVSGDTSAEYTLTPYPVEDSTDPYAIKVRIDAGRFGPAAEGVEFTFYRHSDGPLRIGGREVPLKSKTERTGPEGFVDVDWYPSDAPAEGGTSWDGKFAIDCPSYGMQKSNGALFTVSSTPGGDGRYRPVKVA